MSGEFNEKNYSSKMDKSIQSLKKDISTLRTGRANTNMLDTIKVDVYGQLMPVEQLATISVPEARLISIQVWDKGNINLIESAIQKSELGINPQTDGQIILLLILTIAAAEVAVGLGLVLQIQRRFKTLDLDVVSQMRG